MLRPQHVPSVTLRLLLAGLNAGLFCLAGAASAQEPFVVHQPEPSVECDFALRRLSEALTPQRKLVVDHEQEAHLVLTSARNPDPDGDDGFSLRRDQGVLSIDAQNNRGLMYGILELVSQLDDETPLANVREKAVQAHFPFRAIKFNLPWFSYRDGEHLALHMETCRDLKYWQAFLDPSNSANRLGSFYRATWDGTLYSEAFAKNGGKLIGIDELIKQPVLDDAHYISIDEYVNQGIDDARRVNPLQLADQLDADCKEALRLAAVAESQSDSSLLKIELNDIRSWGWHGQYFARKLRGAVALARYQKTRDQEQQAAAVQYLTAAKACWLQLVEHVERYNVSVMPYQFDQEFSWRKQLSLVERDLEIARGEKD